MFWQVGSLFYLRAMTVAPVFAVTVPASRIPGKGNEFNG
jgi:hypothetical protein